MSDNAALFVDLSSNNGTPNLPKHYKAGHRLLALKATEGTDYTWGDHKRLADEWHHLGGVVWHYHFARPGDPLGQANRFLAAVAACFKPGDVLILDAEVPGVDGKFTTTFLNRVHAMRGNTPLGIYGSAYFLRDNHIRPVHEALLWLAGYPTFPFMPPGWSKVHAHQFSDAAKVDGIPGKVDYSRLLVAHPKHPHKPKHAPTTRKRYRAWAHWLKSWWHW